MYPSDFADLNLLLLQGHLNHLPSSDIRMLSTTVKLWTQNLDATGFKFKHDYTIIDWPRAVVFLVSNNEQKIMSLMRFTSLEMDPTLILEILSRRFFLRLNLPDHKQVQVKMEMEIPCSSGVYFITACS
ncbi:hypothetical protein Tco_0514018 [Tanacetum coccineum]